MYECENDKKVAGMEAQKHYHLKGDASGTAEEKCAALCQVTHECFVFEFDSSHPSHSIPDQPNCRLFTAQDIIQQTAEGEGYDVSANHKTCAARRCNNSYDGSGGADQCPYHQPHCAEIYKWDDGELKKCVSDLGFFEFQIDPVNCGVVENDDDMTCYRFSKFGAVCDAHALQSNTDNSRGDIFDVLRVNAKSSRFPADLCYRFAPKTFNKNFECSPEKAGNGMRLNTNNSSETYSDCRDFCLENRKCVGFDFTAGEKCRYYQGDGQTQDANRTYCQLKTSDRSDHLEAPIMYCMGQSEPDCVYTIQNMFERRVTHLNMRRTSEGTEDIVSEMRRAARRQMGEEEDWVSMSAHVGDDDALEGNPD